VSDIASLFTTGPKQFGLRGDVHLWNAMREHFAGEPMPPTRRALRERLEAVFTELSGLVITHAEERVYIAKYAHGGMSSGQVHLPFWRNKALPFLLGRAGFGDAPDSD
jgi:hypothetical protein